MDAPLNFDGVGREFDKWLDWNGSVNNTTGNTIAMNKDYVDPGTLFQLPISPTSTTNGDIHNPFMKNELLTAPPPVDILTPGTVRLLRNPARASTSGSVVIPCVSSTLL